MRSSRLDIVPLLDIILLLFFALALSMQKEHKKEKKQFVQQLSETNQKLTRTQVALTKETAQKQALKQKFDHLHANHTQLRQVFSHLQRLLGILATDSIGKATGGIPKKQLAEIKRKWRKLQKDIAQLHQQKKALLHTQNKLKKITHQLLARLQQTKEKMLSLQARLLLLKQTKKKLEITKRNLQAALLNTKASLLFVQAKNSRYQKRIEKLLTIQNQKELAYRVVVKRLKEALNKRYAKQTQKLEKAILVEQKHWQKLKLKTLMLQAKLELAKRDMKQQKKQLQRWKTTASALQSIQFRYEAKLQLLAQSNQRLLSALNDTQLKLQKNQLHRQAERKAFRHALAVAEQKEQKLVEQNQHLKASQQQMSSTLKQIKALGRLPGKEKSGLVKSMTQYLLAVFVYVKSDRITGFRRFKDTNITTFDRPIELSRRTSKGQLRYRSVIEPDFRAFARLDTRLPAEIVGSLEAIYIFVFDENTTKAVTSGLEFEHQTKYKARRVIWQL